MGFSVGSFWVFVSLCVIKMILGKDIGEYPKVTHHIILAQEVPWMECQNYLGIPR